MWKCGKCSENVEDNFDMCWNCGTSKDGVENPDFERAADATGSEEPETPGETLACPKCNSGKIVPKVRIMDRGHYGSDTGKDLTVVFYENPDAFIFKGAHEGSLFARVCGECGYTEMFLTNPEDLYSVYVDTEAQRKASIEEDKQ